MFRKTNKKTIAKTKQKNNKQFHINKKKNKQNLEQSFGHLNYLS